MTPALAQHTGNIVTYGPNTPINVGDLAVIRTHTDDVDCFGTNLRCEHDRTLTLPTGFSAADVVMHGFYLHTDLSTNVLLKSLRMEAKVTSYNSSTGVAVVKVLTDLDQGASPAAGYEYGIRYSIVLTNNSHAGYPSKTTSAQNECTAAGNATCTSTKSVVGVIPTAPSPWPHTYWAQGFRWGIRGFFVDTDVSTPIELNHLQIGVSGAHSGSNADLTVTCAFGKEPGTPLAPRCGVEATGLAYGSSNSFSVGNHQPCTTAWGAGWLSSGNFVGDKNPWREVCSEESSQYYNTVYARHFGATPPTADTVDGHLNFLTRFQLQYNSSAFMPIHGYQVGCGSFYNVQAGPSCPAPLGDPLTLSRNFLTCGDVDFIHELFTSHPSPDWTGDVSCHSIGLTKK